MIKFICDRCGKEFKPDKLYLVGKIAEKKTFILPVKGEKPLMGEQPTEQVIHLCSTCVTEFRKWLAEGKGKSKK